MNSLKNKTAIITGASRGIGAEMARRLGSLGMNVVVNYASDAAAAAKVVREIDESGGEALAVQGDVSRMEDMEALFRAAEDRFGGVDVLVNNAGQMHNMPIASIDLDAFDRMFAINVRGVLNGCKLAAQRLRRDGSIVNVSTSVIGMAPAGYGPYCASKAAVEALTRSLCKEVGARGIRVNAIAPGPTDTELLSQANDEDRRKSFAAITPLGRLGQARDMAGVLAFLIGDDAAWITGQTIRVNGGIVA